MTESRRPSSRNRKKSPPSRRRPAAHESKASKPIIRHDVFLEEAARRGAAHPYGQEPIVGYLTLHAVDHVLTFGEGSIPARSVGDKVLTEVIVLPEDAPCWNDYREVAIAVRAGAGWGELEERLLRLARTLEREDRAAEAEDVFRTVQEAYGVEPGQDQGLDRAQVEARGIRFVATGCGQGGLVRALLGRGRTLRKLGRLQDAEETYGRARKRAERAGLLDEEALAAAGLAGLALGLGELGGGEATFEALRRDCRRSRISPDACGSILHEWAAAVEPEDPGRSLVLLWEAFEAYSDVLERGRVLYEVGARLLAGGFYEPARRAFEILRQEAPGDLSVPALTGLLEIAWRTHDALLFRRTWRVLSPLAANLDAALRAECYRYASRMLGTLGRREEARELLAEARFAERMCESEGRAARPRRGGRRAGAKKKISKRALRTDPDLRALVEALDSRWRAACG